MNTLTLVWKNITQQLGSALLSILLTAFGVAILCIIYITGDTFEKQLTNNTKNIDLVVGAKGSPLQLILSSLYHVDNPTGNISLTKARQLAENPFVELAVPISLGDNFKGHRLIGTEDTYLQLYDLKIAEGAIWQQAFEAVIGSEVARKRGLKLNDKFHTAHGLSEDGHVHDEHPFKVVGILEASGSVVDNLILCNLESVWDVHGITHGDDHDHDHDHQHDHAHQHDEHDHNHAHQHEEHDHTHEDHTHDHHTHGAEKSDTMTEEIVSEPPREFFVKSIASDMLEDRGEEVTALLVKYSSPAAMGVLPRLVNESTDMQSASPAIESTRLFSLLGVGLDSLTVLAYVIMIIAGLSVFISLYNALKERKYDLAVMRSMGASQTKLFSLVLVEGLVITAIGGILGLLFGHFALYFINQHTSESADFIQAFALNSKEIWIVLMACFIGLLAAVIPAIKAYRTSISTILSEK
ncbi:ABC transporter permease [Sphingobacterium wenxiniae]|uniref:Putative ABC transport system permease protein n=1 Tax=Sphingobacterium wenxiniae TaxID=683125 RepID=A0A1I6VDH2_9SPHI|nr:FtsX-like permease family protein [Sphingobacterium wenxiniae]SFT11783.1 putative ABC transport system permease protein [Sphingobacterium wenxiniae]